MLTSFTSNFTTPKRGAFDAGEGGNPFPIPLERGREREREKQIYRENEMLASWLAGWLAASC